MKELFVDLHVHTTSSDSTFTPADVIKTAQEIGFSALGITDHDSVSALPIINKLADIEIIPGVELSCEKDGEEIHILGYYISWTKKWFRKKLAKLSQAREERALEITMRLKEIGIDLSLEIIKEISGDGTVGRMHVARALEKIGYVKNVQQAFRLYLGNGKPAYVKKFPLTLGEAVEIIRSVNGISSLAHPGLLKNKELIMDAIKSGVDGLEAFHPEHSDSESKSFLELASQNRLLITGGSDCHGLAKGKPLLGKIKLPYKYLIALKDRKGEN